MLTDFASLSYTDQFVFLQPNHETIAMSIPTSAKRYTNKEVADLLMLVGDILQILEANRFRIIAFQNAAEAIKNYPQDINAIYADGKLQEIAGVGKGIAGAVGELLREGIVVEFEELKRQVPPGVVAMMQVPDMGPKKARRLWQELSINSIDELKAAAEAGKLRELKGFGAKSEEKILKGIELLSKRGDERMPIGVARPLALSIIDGLRAGLPAGTLQRIEAAGSLRRWKETIGDVDILCVSDQPAAVMAAFQSLLQVADVTHAGETKSSVILANGLQVDLRVVEGASWGAALQYFSGSKEHNVPIRDLALRRGWSLNEYCLTATGSGEAPAGEERFFAEEADLYAFLGLDWVPPELRENRGEIQAARTHKQNWSNFRTFAASCTAIAPGVMAPPASKRWPNKHGPAAINIGRCVITASAWVWSAGWIVSACTNKLRKSRASINVILMRALTSVYCAAQKSRFWVTGHSACPMQYWPNWT